MISILNWGEPFKEKNTATSSDYYFEGAQSEVRPLIRNNISEFEKNPSNRIDLSYVRVLKSFFEYVQESFPSSISQIMLMTSTADARDFVIRTIGNTFR